MDLVPLIVQTDSSRVVSVMIQDHFVVPQIEDVTGNGNAHHARNLPIFLADGEFKHGRYIAREKKKNTPLCDLFVTMLNNAGLETESFGQSRGSLTW